MAPAFRILALVLVIQGCLSETLFQTPFDTYNSKSTGPVFEQLTAKSVAPVFEQFNAKSVAPVFQQFTTKSVAPVFGPLTTRTAESVGSAGSVATGAFGTSDVFSNGNLNDVHLSNKGFHVYDRYVDTLRHPVATGEIIGKHVETIPIGQQQAQTKIIAAEPRVAVHTVPVTTHAVVQPVQTQLVQQVVPVQTLQTVQVVQQPQYQVVPQVQQVQREVVQVEKPVPVPRPVPVAEPPKPFVKEAVYARPFQVAQPYVKTRITPFKKIEPEIITTTSAPITTTTPKIHHETRPQKFEEVIEEHLYYVNKKKKIVTKFIKLVDVYEAETDEEVGTYYRLGEFSGDNFDLQVTQIYQADRPFLVRNATSTKQVLVTEGHPVPPKHLVFEYDNNELVHTYPFNTEYGFFGSVKPSKTHFDRFHGHGSAISQGTFGYNRPASSFNSYTFTSPSGQLLKATESIVELPGGSAVFVEKRITYPKDDSPFPANIKPIPAVDEYFDETKGHKVLRIVLTYDATVKQTADSKYGFSAESDFLPQFQKFLSAFEESFKNIPDQVTSSKRSKRSASQIQYNNKNYTKKETLARTETRPGGEIYQSDDGEKIKLEEEQLTAIQGPPRNEYLRYGKIYVPKKKVEYEVVGINGQPIEQFGDFAKSAFSQYFPSPAFNRGSSYDLGRYSYKYGTPYYSHPFYTPENRNAYFY